MKSLPVPPRFGRTDPPTSGQAALDHRVSGQLGRDQQMALDLVRAHPGQTTKELAWYIGSGLNSEANRQRIGRRLSELKAHGLIYREGVRQGCGVWWPVPQKPQGTLF